VVASRAITWFSSEGLDPADATLAKSIEFYAFRIDLWWYLFYIVYDIVRPLLPF
jgi:hypothetical protein